MAFRPTLLLSMWICIITRESCNAAVPPALAAAVAGGAKGGAAAAFKSEMVKVGTQLVKKTADKLFSELFDRNRKDEIDKELKEFSKTFLERSEKDSGKHLDNLNSALNALDRKQSEFIKNGVEISIVPDKGMDMGGMFVPPSWKIKQVYKNVESQPVTDSVTPHQYSNGVGNALLNGCFGSRPLAKNDPCYQALQPLAKCADMMDAANFIGVGFDGRGDYSSASRKKSVIQRTCFQNRKYGRRSVPDTMTVHGVYDTNTKTMAFGSAQKYQSYLERKAAVAQSSYMFREATVKAYGRSSAGVFGLAGGGGGENSFSKDSGYNKQSQFGAQTGQHQASGASGIYMSMLELSVIRYELFLDDVSYDDLNLEFLQEFLALPQSFVGSDSQKFQDFILRWGTHYIKSAKFGGQLKLAKTKVKKSGETIDAFATKAHADYQAMFSTYSARSSQYKSSSWLHSSSRTKESSESFGGGDQGSESSSSQDFNSKAFQQQYSNEALMVEGGDQNIASAISEMYSTGFKHELVDWLHSIPQYPKPFDFQMAPITDLCELNYKSLFPNGTRDMGCLGQAPLLREKTTDRKYYVIRSDEPDQEDANSTRTGRLERRYCEYDSAEIFRDSLRRRCNSLRRAVSVYLEEGPIPSTDIYLPPGDDSCDIGQTPIDDPNFTQNVVPYDTMKNGSHFKVIFDSPVNIPGVASKQEVLVVFYHKTLRKWFVRSKDGVIHLYDGFRVKRSRDDKQKISVRGLTLEYDETTGLLTLDEDDYIDSGKTLPGLPERLSGATLARTGWLSSLHEIREHKDTYGIGAVPCNVVWSNVHRFDRYSESGACVLFTAVSEGDIFIIFSVIPRDRQTWYYLQIGPQGVAIYKGTRVVKFVTDPGARSLGDSRLFESYFACIHENPDGSVLIIKYGKTADNGEEAHVFAVYEDPEPLHVRFYAFGNGKTEATIVDVRMFQTAVSGMQGTRVVKFVTDPGARSLGDSRLFESYFACIHENPDGSVLIIKYGKTADNGEEAHVFAVYEDPEPLHVRFYAFGNGKTEATIVDVRMFQTAVSGMQVCLGGTVVEDGRCVEKCHPECIGCHNSESDRFCRVCKNFKLGDRCVPICPVTHTPQRNSNLCICKLSEEGKCVDQCSSLRKPVAVSSGASHCWCKFSLPGQQECLQSCPPFTVPTEIQRKTVCTTFVRLVEGTTAWNGRVEIYKAESWGTVCDDQWEDVDATVTCKQLGYCGGIAKTRAHFGVGSGRVHMGMAQCTGREDSVLNCPHNENPRNCGHDEDAGVICRPCDIRLIGGTDRFQGRVEVNVDGTWGTICNRGWDEKDANVVCRELGYCNGVTKQFGRGNGPVYYGNLRCQGGEKSIHSCSMDNDPGCSHELDVGVVCAMEAPCMRLVNGSSKNNGRLEINKAGTWGTVCDERWDDNDARVVCRQLGLCGGSATVAAYYGSARRRTPIYVSGVKCEGGEASLFQCPMASTVPKACAHNRDAGVACKQC